MDLVQDERYYITIKEVYLLLAGLELSSIYGITFEEKVIPQKEEINLILAELYQKTIIDWEEGKVVLRQPYADIFQILFTSKRCVTMKGISGKLPLYCCYIGKTTVVMTEKSQREEEMLCISHITYQEWLRCVREYLETEEKNLEQSVKVILEIRDSKTGREYQKLTIIEQGFKTMIVEETAYGTKQWLYSQKALEEKLKIFLWEEET